MAFYWGNFPALSFLGILLWFLLPQACQLPLSLAWGSNDIPYNPLQVFGFHSDLSAHVSTCDPDFWWFSTATSTALAFCCSIAVSKPSSLSPVLLAASSPSLQKSYAYH